MGKDAAESPAAGDGSDEADSGGELAAGALETAADEFGALLGSDGSLLAPATSEGDAVALIGPLLTPAGVLLVGVAGLG